VQSGGSFFPHVFKKYFQDFNAKTHSQILKNPCISEPKTSASDRRGKPGETILMPCVPNEECPMKIVIKGPATPEEVPGITAIANEAELVCAPNKERLAEVLPGADILLGWNFQSRDMSDQWHRVDSLKWIHWCGAAVDRIMSPELRASDITLTNARGIFDSVMAEYVLGYMISELKLFRETWHLQKEKRWQTRLTGKLAGSRAVIFGVGSIGRETARLLRSVGVKVSGVGRRAREDDPDFGTIYSSDRAFKAIEDADWVIGLLPLTEETTLYYGANFFGAMKQEARFMNLGRGESVDESTLIASLEQGTIAGAMLDVFHNEPIDQSNPLWEAPNIVISPHTSSYYAEYEEDMANQFLDNFARFKDHKSLKDVVDKNLGFVPSER
jgi:phosphoglycerate dehydrogenase-like enzyme